MKNSRKYLFKELQYFGVEAKAHYFVEVHDLHELKYATEFAKINHIKILFLGGGSNLLFTQDFDGLVIKLNLKGISEENLDENHVHVSAKAGENWHEFVLYTLSKNYGGLENLSLIPGNVELVLFRILALMNRN
jgi:UDP-N-acetylmuramate dehydrogenase